MQNENEPADHMTGKILNRPFRVMLARFPGGHSEHPASSDWTMKVASQIMRDARFEDPYVWWKSDTPITMVRNEACKIAVEKEMDFIVMVDSDMGPDMEHPLVRSAAPFWKSTVDFLLRRYVHGPCIVAAPYCGPPPHENVFVFRWRTLDSSQTGEQIGFALEQYTREEAADEGGIKEVAAIPTGVVVADVRIFSGFKCPETGQSRALPAPWFYYEYEDELCTKKASTEDVAFSRDVSLLGVPVYCNWDAWALHYKLKGVGKPLLIGPKHVTDSFKRAYGLTGGQVLVKDPPAPKMKLAKEA